MFNKVLGLALLGRRRNICSTSRLAKKLPFLLNTAPSDSESGSWSREKLTDPDRKFGYFICPNCRKSWRSSLAWCHKGTDKPLSGQQCKNTGCPDDYIKPFKVEPLRCPKCHSVITACNCKPDKRKKSPHLSALCERCRGGLPCYSH